MILTFEGVVEKVKQIESKLGEARPEGKDGESIGDIEGRLA